MIKSETLQKLLRMAMCLQLFLTGEAFLFQNRDAYCLLPQVRRSILREAMITTEPENRSKNFRATVCDKIRYTVESD
jgi:hypothetical protein